MPRLAFHQHEVIQDAPARRRRRMIAGAASGTAVLRLAAPSAACGPPPGNPETGTLLIPSSGPFAHRPTATLAAVAHAETETSSGRRDHETAGQHVRGSP
jgi:hypothetical protein